MGPQLYEVTLIYEGLVGGFCDSLEDLREVSQVVNVMRFSWSREQFFGGLHLGVELNSGAYDIILEIGDGLGQGLRQVGEVPLKDSAEYLDKRLSVEGLNVDQVEVPDVTHGHHISATDGRKHSSYKVDAAEVLELFGL